jgi:hypothetical protein
MVPTLVATRSLPSVSSSMSRQVSVKKMKETSEETLFTHDVSAYRAHFSLCYTGRVNARSKRKITWRFGLCINSPDGSRRVIREEHQIELTWSINSGKVCLLWNNKDISHFFPSTKSRNPPTKVEYSWQSSAGVAFQIEAHAMPPGDGKQQYELLIGGRSFFSLPSASEFLALRRADSNDDVGSVITPDKTPTSPPMRRAPVDETSQTSVQEDESFPPVPKELHQRHEVSSSCTEEDLVDKLKSDLYSSSLDALRGEMTSAVPELEEMMSRAIVYAYSEDHDSLGSCSVSNHSYGSFATQDELDPAETEADALFETYDWMKWTMLHEAATDIYDLKLDFMRGQVETIVAHARHERLSPHAASSIMIGIAAILNLKLARRMQRSTVILAGMRPDISTQDVYRALSVFGEIETVCTAMGEHGFAVCHFSTEASANALFRCPKSELSMLGDRFDAFNLYAKPFPWSKPISGPGRVQNASTPRHRRRIVEDGDFTISANHMIRQEVEGVECYDAKDDDDAHNELRKSLELHGLEDFKVKAQRRPSAKHKKGLDSLEFSSSRVLISPNSSKEMSNGTMSTLSTLDGEEVNRLVEPRCM